MNILIFKQSPEGSHKSFLYNANSFYKDAPTVALSDSWR